jgi:hypothetical protein
MLQKFAHDPDMSKAAGCAAAECQTDGGAGDSRLRLRGRFRRTIAIARSHE